MMGSLQTDRDVNVREILKYRYVTRAGLTLIKLLKAKHGLFVWLSLGTGNHDKSFYNKDKLL